MRKAFANEETGSGRLWEVPACGAGVPTQDSLTKRRVCPWPWQQAVPVTQSCRQSQPESASFHLVREASAVACGSQDGQTLRFSSAAQD